MALLTIKDDRELEGNYSTIIEVRSEISPINDTMYFVIGGLLVAVVF